MQGLNTSGVSELTIMINCRVVSLLLEVSLQNPAQPVFSSLMSSEKTCGWSQSQMLEFGGIYRVVYHGFVNRSMTRNVIANLASSSVTSLFEPLPAAYSRRIRCLKSAFQTPSSNSCNKSTTSIFEGSNFSPNRLINALYRNISRQLANELDEYCTLVGTLEVSLSRSSTSTPLMGLARL